MQLFPRAVACCQRRGRENALDYLKTLRWIFKEMLINSCQDVPLEKNKAEKASSITSDNCLR